MVAVLGELLGRIASTYMSRKTRQAEQRFCRRALTLCDLEIMDTNKDGGVERGEFLAYMLVALQKVDKKDVDGIMQLFQNLDVSGNGFLNKEDLRSRDWNGNLHAALDSTISPGFTGQATVGRTVSA
jgi:hypothetical protein